jgi:hypothetical protein
VVQNRRVMNRLKNINFPGFMAVIAYLMILVWVCMPCGGCLFQCFGKIYCLHPEGDILEPMSSGGG